jgi:uncharacterized repeat protein (TIGR03803 family)
MRTNYIIVICAVALVFVIVRASTAAQQYKLTTLASFDGLNGAFPESGLAFDSAGNLYGTTFQGGGGLGDTSRHGTLFKIDANTHVLSKLATFDPRQRNLNSPNGTLFVDANNNLFGTTLGSGGIGSLFEVAANTNTIVEIARFGGDAGRQTFNRLTSDASGNLYGTANQGGANSFGTVFEFDAATRALLPVVTFDGANGAYPAADLITDSQGNLYGTSAVGGDLTLNNGQGFGTVIKIDAVTHALSTLAVFNGANGASPQGELAFDSLGNLYGATGLGGANNLGTVFELDAATHSISTLVTFDGANGANPFAGVFADAGGNLFGTTRSGGNLAFGSGLGTVFEIDAQTHTLTTLAKLDPSSGFGPFYNVVMDASGNLYGTGTDGGAHGLGTVFELSPVPEPATCCLAVDALFTSIVFAFGGRFALPSRGRSTPRCITAVT